MKSSEGVDMFSTGSDLFGKILVKGLLYDKTKFS